MAFLSACERELSCLNSFGRSATSVASNSLAPSRCCARPLSSRVIRAAAVSAPRRGSASKVAASKASSLPTGARGRLVSSVPVLELVPVRVMVRVRRAVALGVVRRCEGKGLGVRVVVVW